MLSEEKPIFCIPFCIQLGLAFGRRGANVVAELNWIKGYEAILDCSDRWGRVGACASNICRWLRRRGLPRWWMGWLSPRRRVLPRRLRMVWRLRLGMGRGLWLLRLWVGRFCGRRRPGLLRRVWLLRVCTGLRRARLQHPGVCSPGLHGARRLFCTCLRHFGLHDSGLYDCGVPDGVSPPSSSGNRCNHHSAGAGLDDSGPCRPPADELCRAGLRQLSQPINAGDRSLRLHRRTSHPSRRTASRPTCGPDLLLDDSPSHDLLLGEQPVACPRLRQSKAAASLRHQPSRWRRASPIGAILAPCSRLKGRFAASQAVWGCSGGRDMKLQCLLLNMDSS